MKLKRLFPFEMDFILPLLFSSLAIHLWGFDGPLDMKFYYSNDEANRLFAGLTTAGVETYLRSECFDFLLLLSYSALLFRILSRLFSDNSTWRWLGLIPGVFDFIETFMICLVLLGVIPTAPAWLGFMTLAKWTSLIFVTSLICFRFLRRKFT